MGLGWGGTARLALRNIRRRSSVPLLLALIVPSASIMVPLTMGDSFQQSLRDEIFDSLGQVDEVVRSSGVMRQDIFDHLQNDTRLAGLTDGLAPALLLPGILTGPSDNRTDTQVDVIGVDGRSSPFGGFTDASGGAALPQSIPPGGVYLREDCARRIGAAAGDAVVVRLRDPAYSLESIYTPGAPVHESTLNVTAVVQDNGLGALRIVPRGPPRRAAFVDIGWLMNATASGGVNLILVSNNGDARGGIDGTADVVARLGTLLDGSVGYGEGGFGLTATPGYVKLQSDNIFFDGELAENVRASDSRVSSISVQTSYFVNMIMANGSWIAYSTVTAIDPAADAAFGAFLDNATGQDITGDMGDGEIIVTSYAAGRLGLNVGDSVTLNYSVYDSSFRQQFRYSNFTVRHIVDLEGKADDPELMPPFPGIKGKASCGDWRPPIPIDYSIMVQDDLTYWRAHGGAPKAYVTLSKGMELWGNDLGNITTVKALPAPGINSTELAPIIGRRLNESLSPARLGVIVEPVKHDAVDSVAGLDIVTEALVSFGSAVTASGMVLIYVVVLGSIEGRRREIGILRSLGFTRRNVAAVFTIEGTVLSLAGSAAGVVAGLAFAGLGVWASNSLWAQILPVRSGLYLPGPEWIAAAFFAGAVLSTIAFAIGARASARGDVASNIRGLPGPVGGPISSIRKERVERRAVPYPPPVESPIGEGAAAAETIIARRRSMWPTIACIVAMVVVGGMGTVLAASAGDMLLMYYFLVGYAIILLAGFIIYRHMEGLAAALSRGSRLGRISLANSARNRRRSGAYVMVYALVIFPLLTLSAYIPVETSMASSQTSLRGGGYDIMGTSEVPLYFDLGDAAARARQNVTGFPDVSVVQFASFGSPGGTCSNLNTKAPPRILAANASFVRDSKIPFVSSLDGSSGNGPWRLLDRDGGMAGAAGGSTVPVIGDYTTVVWIFNKGLDGAISIKDEEGHPVKLRIVGILHDSIFQGSVFLSEAAMRRLYPTQAAYNMFLFSLEGPGAQGGLDAGEAAVALESSLAAFGFSAREVRTIAAGFIEVDMAYASMLQAMLAAGILIGTMGFAAKVANETVERRFELGVMRAIGFQRGRLARLVLAENMFIFCLGFATALASAWAATMIFLGAPPSLPDTLLLFAILACVTAVSALWPVRLFNRRPVAGWLRIPD